MPADVPAPVEVFISYSHKDDRLREKLGTHLSLLKRQGVIDVWHDRRITAGGSGRVRSTSTSIEPRSSSSS